MDLLADLLFSSFLNTGAPNSRKEIFPRRTRNRVESTERILADPKEEHLTVKNVTKCCELLQYGVNFLSLEVFEICYIQQDNIAGE